MAQTIKQGDLFGRIGSGIGQGLAAQLPEEMNRGRLAAGLEKLGQEKGLTPFQKFSRLAALPGTTPQIIQSGSDLLRQEGMLRGAGNIQAKDQVAFDEIRNRNNISLKPDSKGLVGTQNTQAALEPAIPKTFQELQSRAAELNQENPALYPDYNTALDAATREDSQRIAQNQAQQNARQTQRGVESDIRNELRNLQSAANAKVPDNIYQEEENRALEEIANGKNELTAAKDARDRLDSIARDYNQLDSYGDITLIASNPKKVKDSIKDLRKSFEKRNDLENFADQLVARNGLSNQYANYLSNPPSGEIEKTLNDLPLLKVNYKKGYYVPPAGEINKKTSDIIPKLARMLDKNDNILAIAHILEDKGYDSQMWRNYLSDNQDKLNLSASQIRQLRKVDKTAQGFLNDSWLQSFGGP